MDSTTYSLRGAARSLVELVTGTFRSTLHRGYNAAAYSLATTERLVGLCAGAAIGGTQGALVLSKYILESATPAPVRRMLPNLPLLHGMGGRTSAEGERQEEKAEVEQEAQVIGMGGGYTLNVASAEAFPEPPSPQFVPPQSVELREDQASPEFIKSTEDGIGAAAMHMPQTPVMGAGPTYAPYSPERPGFTESPHTFGERYVGHEVESLGTELQGAEEPRARLEALAKETQDLRALTTQRLREAEALPGEEEELGGRPPSGPLPAALATMSSAEYRARTSPAPLEHMPADMITGEEGRPLPPSLSMLPEGQEEMPPPAEGEEEAPAGAEARLKGLFAPALAVTTGAAVAAPAMATAGRAAPSRAPVSAEAVPSLGPSTVPAAGAEVSALSGPEAAEVSADFEAVEAARLEGITGERVGVRRVPLPALGTTTELESTIIAEEKVTAEVVEQHRQRIMEGGTWAAPAAAATGAAAVGAAAASRGGGIGAREMGAGELAGGELAVGEEAPAAGIMKVSPSGLPAEERTRAGTAGGIAVEEPAVERQAPSSAARELAAGEALEGKPAAAAELAGQDLGAATGVEEPAVERQAPSSSARELAAGEALEGKPAAAGELAGQDLGAATGVEEREPAGAVEHEVPTGLAAVETERIAVVTPELEAPPAGRQGGAKVAPEPELYAAAPAGRMAAPEPMPEILPSAAAPAAMDKAAPVKKKRSRNPFHKLKKMLKRRQAAA